MSKDIKYYINCAIGIIFMFGFGYLPVIEPLTDVGMKVMGILIGLIWLWSTVDVGWPTFAAFAALLLTGCMAATDIYSAAFANLTVVICLFLLLTVAPLGESGIFNYVTNWMSKLNFLKGHPWRLTAMLLVANVIGYYMQGGFAVYMMTFAMIFNIADSVGMERTHPWVASMVVAAALVNCLISNALPFLAGPLFVLGMFAGTAMATMNFLAVIAYCFIFSVLVLVLYFIAMKLVFRIDVSALKNMDVDKCLQELPPMSKQQKACAALLIGYVAALVLTGSASVLPAGAFATFLTKMGLVGASWIFLTLMLIIKVDGEHIVTTKTIAKAMPWEAFLICSVGITVGNKMLDPTLGITTMLSGIFAPLLGGHSPYVFMMMMLVFALILTNIVNNSVVILLMAGIAMALAPTMPDLNIFALAVPMIFAGNVAMLLPGSSVIGAIMHGYGACVGKKNLYIWSVVAMVCTTIVFAIMIPVGNSIL